MLDVHFGAGNIGRGFIGETLAKNDFSVTFVDMNDTVIDELNKRHSYTVEMAAEGHETEEIKNVQGINNGKNPDDVSDEIANADLVTTAIGPNVLKAISSLIADGIKKRKENNNTQTIDVVACENMIDGSQTLKGYVYDSLNDDEQKFADQYVGFPNAAVDRIVPLQKHDDPLYVSVEPFKEWIIDESQMKNSSLKLDGVDYVPDLEPYIERKLFTVNTGHATIAYNGNMKGYKTIGESVKDDEIIEKFKSVIKETGTLLIDKFNFDEADLKKYQETVLNRFKNQYISDTIERVGRTPIRKLGYNERFIRPIRELKERNESYDNLVATTGTIFYFDYPDDDESVKLQKQVKESPIEDVIREDTELKDDDLVNKIAAAYNSYK